VRAADGVHVDDLPVDQFDALAALEDACLRHFVIIGDIEPVTGRRWWTIKTGAHGGPLRSGTLPCEPRNANLARHGQVSTVGKSIQKQVTYGDNDEKITKEKLTRYSLPSPGRPRNGPSLSIISDYRCGWSCGALGAACGVLGRIVRESGGKSAARRSLGAADFAESAGARRGASPAVRAPMPFFGPKRGVGRDLGVAGLSFPGRQDGAASIGAAQRIKTMSIAN